MTQNKIKDFLKQHQGYLKKSPAILSRKFSIDFETAKWLMAQVKQELKGTYKSEPLQETYTQDIQFKTAFVEKTVTKEINTLEDLIKECKIDIVKWDIVKYTQGKHEGFVKDSNGEAKKVQLFTVKAWLKEKKVDTDLSLQKEAILEQLKLYSPKVEPFETYLTLTEAIGNKRKTKGALLELAIFDLHLGKLAHEEETGENYDMKIAKERYKNAIYELLSRVDTAMIDRILLPIGNDLMQVDNKAGTTTQGTFVDHDSRYHKMLRYAKKLIIETVDELSTIAPVDVVVIPGNHDEVSMFCLGEILEAFYHNNENVTIYNEPTLRKYYKYGNVGLLFTHGDKEKISELPLIFATENPKVWSSTKYREIHCGHIHHKKTIQYLNLNEFHGAKVRFLSSLSATDGWHAGRGYMSEKAADAFLWDQEKGLLAHFNYSL